MRITPVRAVAALLVVLLVLGAAGLAVSQLVSDDSSGSSGGRSSSTEKATLAPTPTPEAGSSEPPAPDLAAFYGQTIDWELCRDDTFECGTLTVPIDYQDPSGQTVDLALLKVPAAARSGRVGSLVVDPGGPGASGVEYAAAAAQAFGQPLLDAFDIVGFDPRGVGGSDPIDCLSDSQLDTFLAADPVPDTAPEEQDYAAARSAFWQGCVDHTDSILGHVTTVEAARDMDVLRSALGETTLTYFGASYGTQLGATYADLFPDKVGRFVLDGAVDLSISARQLAIEQAGGFETALRAFVQNCVDEGDCVLGDSVDAGLTSITDLLAALAEDPLPTQDSDRPLTEGLAFSGIATSLYSRDFWKYLDQGLDLAQQGNGALLLALADLQPERQPDGTFASNISEAFPAISCLDNPYSVAPDQVAAQLPDFEAASPTFGDAFAWQLVTCRGIQVTATETDKDITGAGAPPIVVVGTTRDPATPYQWAVHLAAQLESGVLVTRDGDGHTGYNSGNDCVDSAVEGYLIDDTVPQDGLKC